MWRMTLDDIQRSQMCGGGGEAERSGGDDDVRNASPITFLRFRKTINPATQLILES